MAVFALVLELVFYAAVLTWGTDLGNPPGEREGKLSPEAARRSALTISALALVLTLAFQILVIAVPSIAEQGLAFLGALPLALAGSSWLLHLSHVLRRCAGRFTAQVAAVYRGANIVPGRFAGSDEHRYVLYEPFFEYFYDGSAYCTASSELYGRDELMRMYVPGREYVVHVDPARGWDFICSPCLRNADSCRTMAAVYLVLALVTAVLGA